MATSKIKPQTNILRNLSVVVDDYYAGGTSGQTHLYTLQEGAIYILFIGKINGAGTGFYLITANTNQTMVGALQASSVSTVTASALTLSVKIDANYTRVVLLKMGG